MKAERLENMVKGWFVGAFSPTVFHTDACEVAVKTYRAGDNESAHYHKIATEITVIISGEVKMCGKIWRAGDIIEISPGEVASFVCIKDAVTVCVKLPGVLQDKYEMSGEIEDEFQV